MGEPRLTTKPSPPSQAVTDFTNVYAGCDAVTAVTPLFYLDESHRAAFFQTLLNAALIKSAINGGNTNFGYFGNDNDLAVPLLNRNMEHQPEQPNLKQVKDLKRFVPCSASSCNFES